MRCGLVWRGDVDLFFLKRYLSESHKKIEIPTGIVFIVAKISRRVLLPVELSRCICCA